MNRVHDPVTLAYHELRGPLGLIVTAARAAAEECPDSAVRGRCEVIVRTAERMLRDAQELFRVMHGAATDVQTFLPERVIAEVVEDLRDLGIPIDLVMGQESGARALGHPAVLESLAHCVLSNAHDHLEAGGRIRVVVAREQQWLLVRVFNPPDVSGRHCGIGAGRLIEQRLADELGARISHEACEALYLTELRLPASFV